MRKSNSPAPPAGNSQVAVVMPDMQVFGDAGHACARGGKGKNQSAGKVSLMKKVHTSASSDVPSSTRISMPYASTA